MFNRKEYMKEWHKKNYQKNKEHKKEYMKQYYRENKEYLKEQGRKFYWDNREKELAIKKIWVKDNPEYHKDYYKRNKDKKLEQNRKWYRTEKGKSLSQRKKIRRQIRFKNILNTLTSQEWLDLLEEYNYRCAYCGIEFDCENLPTKDHVIPISKGGDNTKENIVPACRSCNSKKHDKIINIKGEIRLCHA